MIFATGASISKSGETRAMRISGDDDLAKSVDVVVIGAGITGACTALGPLVNRTQAESGFYPTLQVVRRRAHRLRPAAKSGLSAIPVFMWSQPISTI